MTTSLNSQQKCAVDCDDSKIVCLAGAGTGKTYTLIQRILRLCQSCDPSSILALTFTNAAAFEMRERFRKLWQSGNVPQFRTFHSFCYSLICDNPEVRSALNMNSIPKIATDADAKQAETKAKLQVNFNVPAKKMKNKSLLSIKERYMVESLIKAKRRILKENNLITFDELCSTICELFIQNHPAVQVYKDKYKYIFVDEFQDTDQLQWDFVSSFVNASIFVCGDALQAIYGFRNADSSIIKSLTNSEDWTTIKLETNYRSTKPICDAANRMSTYADDSYRIAICTDKSGPKVEYEESKAMPYMTLVDEDVVEDISDKLQEYSGTSAILFRTNAEVSQCSNMLKSLHIDVESGKKDADPENMLKSAIDNKYMIDWLSTFLNSEKYADFVRKITILDDQATVPIFVDNYGDIPQIKYRIDAIRTIRQIVRNTLVCVEDKIKSVLTAIGVEYSSDIDDIIPKDLNKPVDIVTWCVSYVSDKSNSQIYVGTVHSVKGLEYDNVFVVGPGGPSWKLNTEENLNLYYVAITRAKSRLVVYKGDWL